MVWADIQPEFNKIYGASAEVVALISRMQKQAVTYAMAQQYAIVLGEVLAETYAVTGALRGASEEAIARGLLEPALRDNYDLASQSARMAQDDFNRASGIGLKAVAPKVQQGRIDGLVGEVTSKGYDNIRAAFDEQVVNFTQAAVDDTMESNAYFLEHTGLVTQYRRHVNGDACKWCQSLAGTYTAHDAPDGFFGHHTNCQCLIEPIRITKSYTSNYWTQKWDKAQAKNRG